MKLIPNFFFSAILFSFCLLYILSTTTITVTLKINITHCTLIVQVLMFGGLIDFTRQELLESKHVLITALREGRKFIDLFLSVKSTKLISVMFYEKENQVCLTLFLSFFDTFLYFNFLLFVCKFCAARPKNIYFILLYPILSHVLSYIIFSTLVFAFLLLSYFISFYFIFLILSRVLLSKRVL